MGKKPVQNLLLMVIIAAMMFGGGMVQEGRKEMWVNTTPDVSLATKQDNATGTTGSSGNFIQQIADITRDEISIRTSNCPHAHGGF